MKKTLSVFLSLFLLLSVLSGCGGTEAQSAAPAEAEVGSPYPIAQLTIGTTMSIEKAVRDEYNYDMLASSATELPLLRQDVSGHYLPLLCDFSTEDSVTWTYTLKDGLLWDDGEAVTAEDILFTLEYEDAAGTANFNDKTDAEGKTAAAKYSGYELSEDGRSISLTLAEPNVREPGNMVSFRIMPRHIYEGKDSVTEAESRIGCGPYVFESFNREAGSVSFTANPNFPEQPHVGRLVFRLFGSEDTMYMALRSGDIDLVWNYSSGVPANYAEVLGETVKLTSVSAANVPAVLAFNNARGFFAEEELRLAVSCALDYEQFRTLFGSEHSLTPGRGFAPATTLGYIDTPELARDPAAAENHMRAAGYEKNENGFFEKNGAEAAFTLSYNAEKEVHSGCAELIKTQLENFGIRVTLEGLDKDSYNAKTSNKFSENNITMEAALYGFTAAGMGMGSGLGSIYVDGSHAVQGGCQVFGEEFAAVKQALDGAKSVEEYYDAAAQLQTYYAEHCPLLALYWDNLLYACSDRLDNVTADAIFGLNNAVNWMTLTEE
ncbi:MAG: ABC transporter substrate-binding protein [Clostridiales bacterium]|nr:ABC transporter substrate-binding protein [Candidatus Apopatocola equi]